MIHLRIHYLCIKQMANLELDKVLDFFFFLDISDQELADKILGPQQTTNKTKRTQNHRKAAGKVET